MESENRFVVGDHLALLNDALRMACAPDGASADKATIDKATRAALGYFVLRAAREGERDAKTLARTAVRCLRDEPEVVTEMLRQI